MKIRKVTVGIKNIETALDDFVQTGMAVQEGIALKSEKGVYFTSIDAFRKALTPKRLALLKTIKEKKPSSLRQLALISDRNIKNVSMDIKFLEQAGLLEMDEASESDRKTTPRVNYDKILFEIPV